MKLHSVADESNGYSSVYESENGIWRIGIKPVIFGTRVIAYRNDAVGPCVDYCAGSDRAFLANLFAVMYAIFSSLPEITTEREMMQLMPPYKVRPIDKDPCWEELQRMAANSR